MVLARGHVGVARGDLGQALVPVGHGDRDAVRLGGGHQVLALAAVGELERVVDDAVHAHAGEHGFLDRHLARRAFEQAPAHRGVFAFGVLAHDEEVDVAGLAVRQRAGHAGHQAHGAQVHVLVEVAADLDEQAPHGDVVGHLGGVAHGTEVDGVVALDLVGPVGRHHQAGAYVVVGAPVEMVVREIDAEAPTDRVEHAKALGHDFDADAVSGNDGNPVLLLLLH
ncbi:hypothetical protein D9M68_433170 [compost metagenome]